MKTFAAEDGAVPGDYVVTVVKREEPEVKNISMENYVPPSQMPPGEGPKHLLPKQYAQRASTPLKVTVEESGNEPFDFQLSEN